MERAHYFTLMQAQGLAKDHSMHPPTIESKVITHYALLGSVTLLFHRKPFVSSWLFSDVTRNAQTSLSFCEHDSDTEAPRICNCADDLTLGSAEMASKSQTLEEEGASFLNPSSTNACPNQGHLNVCRSIGEAVAYGLLACSIAQSITTSQ